MRLRSIIGPTLLALVAATSSMAPAASTEAIPLPSLSADRLLDLAKIDLPPAGVSLEIHADFPVDAPLVVDDGSYTAITATVNSLGDVTTQSAVATDAVQADGEAAHAQAVDECSDSFFTPTGRKWQAEDLPVVWVFRRGSIPGGLGLYRTQHSLRAAHSSWKTSNSNCGESDRIDFDFEFGGLTNKKIDYDGANVIDFGPLDNALAINYTWYEGPRALEADLRFNSRDYRWTNREGGKNRYQIANVAAHELGHQIGLDDLGDPHGGLTMFGRVLRGEMGKLSLGAGDIRGASVLTP
jgi:matrixin